MLMLALALRRDAHAQSDSRSEGYIGKDGTVLEVDDCPPPPQVKPDD